MSTEWAFPPAAELPDNEDLIAVGADLEPSTLLAAYAAGYFPMPVSRRRIGWFHPNPRGVIWPGRLHVSRSLQRSLRRFRFTVDTAFEEVILACGDPARPMGWIDNRIIKAYTRLHHLGWAHSVEVWDDDGLAGGVYGLAIGGFFAGESMFHRRTDASKAALVHLTGLLDGDGALLDVQWVTPHLASLGAVEVDRLDYCALLGTAIAAPAPTPFAPAPRSESGAGPRRSR